MTFFNHHLEVFRSLLSGYTLTRSLMDLEARSFELSGNVLDVGSKTNQATYYRNLNTKLATLTFSDINPQSDGVIKLNFEKKLSIHDHSFDGVIELHEAISGAEDNVSHYMVARSNNLSDWLKGREAVFANKKSEKFFENAPLVSNTINSFSVRLLKVY